MTTLTVGQRGRSAPSHISCSNSHVGLIALIPRFDAPSEHFARHGGVFWQRGFGKVIFATPDSTHTKNGRAPETVCFRAAAAAASTTAHSAEPGANPGA